MRQEGVAEEKKNRVILQTAPDAARNCRMRRASASTPRRRRTRRSSYFTPAAARWGVRSRAGRDPGRSRRHVTRGIRAMVKGTEFLADVKRVNVELEPLPGEAVQALVERTLNVPAGVRERAKLAFGR